MCLVRECLKNEIGPENAQYGYPESVLIFVRKIAPREIVGEIRYNSFQVTQKMFCAVMNIP